MNHIVTLDSGAKEIESLIQGNKSMIISGADIKCSPYGMVDKGDILYFVYNNDSSEVKARGIVSTVYNSYPMTVAESYEMVIRNQDKLCLPDNLFYRWAGKKYLVLIELQNVEEVQPFSIAINSFSCKEVWIPIGNIEDSILRDLKAVPVPPPD